MRLHETFEWDPDKAIRNAKKHGVKFEDAAITLEDEDASLFHVESFDSAHSEAEDRYVTIASHPFDRSIVLKITWTVRDSSDGRVTRIISARNASPAEVKKYADEVYGS